MRVLARFARLLFGEYSLYFIYRFRQSDPVESAPSVELLRLTQHDLKASGRGSISEQAWYAGSESESFGLADERGINAVCFYWHGARYGQTRGFWPLEAGEAKLVQIVVDPATRGRGAATSLIKTSTLAMVRQGWSTLYARVWHSNLPSLRAFERAGWTRVAFVVELFPFGLTWKIRFRIPLRRRRDR